MQERDGAFHTVKSLFCLLPLKRATRLQRMSDATLAKELIERGTIAVYETAMGY